jgi:predicted transcriptional regulator
MRTTLDVDDDVLAAVEELASRQNSTAGKVISDLVRNALTRPLRSNVIYRNGLPVLPKRGSVVTREMVERLAETEM